MSWKQWIGETHGNIWVHIQRKCVEKYCKMKRAARERAEGLVSLRVCGSLNNSKSGRTESQSARQTPVGRDPRVILSLTHSLVGPLADTWARHLDPCSSSGQTGLERWPADGGDPPTSTVRHASGAPKI